jgi:phosphotransferase system enzyme I (PtsI)
MKEETQLKGNPVSGGYASAPAFLYVPFQSSLTLAEIPASQISPEKGKYVQALSVASQELEQVISALKKTHPDKAGIIQAQKLMLEDEDMNGEIQEAIAAGSSAAKAISEVYLSYMKLLSASKDDLIRARAADLGDLKNRLLRCLEGKKAQNLSALASDVILVCHDLTPSEAAGLDLAHVKGLICEIGGETSHTAILARSYLLPAVLGVSGALTAIQDGSLIGLDALKGEVTLEVTASQQQGYVSQEMSYLEEKRREAKYLPLPGQTEDGKRILINLNLGDAEKQSLSQASYVDGVGLLRSEFLYMKSDHLPTEEEQFSAYQKVLLSFKGKPVIIRTLDIGGDKRLPYFELPKEDNPMLGERALRLCLAHKGLFDTQLRALLRASVYGQLWIMFPMVGTIEDIKAAKAEAEKCRLALQAEKKPVSSDIKIGVMIEIPSLALLADQIAPLVDFASIGSNDLTQYTLAADRGNPALRSYYQKYNPAVLRLIKMASDAFNQAGKPISVCGELGGDAIGAPLLVGLGFGKLSMSFSNVAKVKRILAHNKAEDLKKIVDICLNLGSEEEVISYVGNHLRGGE